MKPFPWRPGMVVLGWWKDDPARFRLTADNVASELLDHASEGRLGEKIDDNVLDLIEAAQPDRTDPATLGALLGAVREVWGAEAHCTVDRGRWVVWTHNPSGWRAVAHGATEFDALLAAYEAAPVAQ